VRHQALGVLYIMVEHDDGMARRFRMRRFRLHAFGFIMYLVLALLKVALVNFRLH